MPDPPMPPDDAGAVEGPDFLVEQYVAGRLADDQAARLLGLLRADPDLGRSLLDQLAVDAMLRSLSQLPPGDEDLPLPSPAGRPGRRSWRAPALAGAVVVVLLAWGTWAIRDRWPRGRVGGEAASQAAAAEPTTAAVAVLARTVDATWADTAEGPEDGSPLNPGWLRLASGLAEVEFYGGARVVLEGPGELQLRSSAEAFCSSGRLSAEVPPAARGFRVGTPGGAVVDLGTSFGLDVTGAGSEVHVFKGEVELYPESRSLEGLKAGEAAAVAGDGRVRRFAADASSFTTPSVMERRAAEALARRYAAWRAEGSRRDADPSLVVRLDFEGLSPGDRTLPNRAAGAPAGPATIIGCGRVDGRWPGKGGLEFRGVSDRVRLEVPGELASATFMAWVRVNGLDRRFNSLFMSDAFGPGAAHWQILNDGRVRLGVAGRGGPGHVDYDSPVVFAPERLGRWVHLAVVLDASRREVIHYVEGRPVSREPARSVAPLRIGRAELGNWNPRERADRVPIRHFSGRIDEFSVHRRALDASEVARAFAAGAGSGTVDD